MNNKLLTTGQAAKICSVTPDTVLKWIHSGRLPATRTPGGHHRVSVEDLEQVLVGGDQKSEDAAVDLGERPERPFRYCWEFNGKGELREGCKECVVYEMRAERCYEVVERAREIGHQKVFCQQSCAECDYYRAVHDQAANVLVITDNEVLAETLKSGAAREGFNLEVTDCEYTTSAVVDSFRPDVAVVDCSLGKQLTRDICDHLVEDPRVPFIRVVLAAGEGEVPAECDKEVFARIEKPFDIRHVAEFVSGRWGERRTLN